MMNANVSSNPGDTWDLTKDPIWGTPVIETHEPDLWTLMVNSPRCGGWYSIDNIIARKIKNWSNHEKTRLTSWFIEQRRSGIECPKITKNVLDLVQRRNNMSEPDRADAILKHILSKTGGRSDEDINYGCDPIIAKSVRIDLDSEQERNYYELLAYSESANYKDLDFLIKGLQSRRLIANKDPSNNYWVLVLTFEGYSRLGDLQKPKTESKKGFMAMWFDSSMDQAWREGFEPAIKKAGYEPVRIDQKQHVNKINDEMIDEIRRSRFMVADFTQDETGARGGVYYEAGFAHGLGIPVIFTCHEDCLENIHFDVRQYNCIIWKDKDLEKLQKDLTNRITAILGDGPVRP